MNTCPKLDTYSHHSNVSHAIDTLNTIQLLKKLYQTLTSRGEKYEKEQRKKRVRLCLFGDEIKWIENFEKKWEGKHF